MKFNNSLEAVRFREKERVKRNLMKIGTVDAGIISIAALLHESLITLGALGLSIRYLTDIRSSYIMCKNTKIIMKSKEYKQCIELYNKYVVELTKLFESLKLNNSLEISIAYDYILSLGLLSKDNNFEYKVFEEDIDYVTELYGTRIATGNGVCRHTSTLLTDLLNQLGKTAANISVKLYNEDRTLELISDVTEEKIIYDHMVTGMLIDNKKLIYDATNHCIGTFSKTQISNLKINPKFYAVATDCYLQEKGYNIATKNGIYVVNRNQIYFDHNNFKAPNNLNNILEKEMYNIDEEKIKNTYKKIENIIYDNVSSLAEFYNKEIETMEELSRFNHILAPHSDIKVLTKTK